MTPENNPQQPNPSERTSRSIFSSVDAVSKLLISNDSLSNSENVLFQSGDSLLFPSLLSSSSDISAPKNLFSSNDWIREYYFSSSSSHYHQPSYEQQQPRKRTFSSADLIMSSCHETENDEQNKKNAFSSKDWIGQYSIGHEDVKYNPAMLFRSSDLPTPVGNKWDEMYFRELLPAVAVAAAAEPAPEPVASSASSSSSNKSSLIIRKLSKTKRKSKQQPRQKDVEEEEEDSGGPKIYVDKPTDTDVFFGRGGRSNKHKGNKIYRQIIEHHKQEYGKENMTKPEKTKISQKVVDEVQGYGGRFLCLDKTIDKWYIASDTTARKKASQALREENTPEARKAKREKYKYATKP